MMRPDPGARGKSCVGEPQGKTGARHSALGAWRRALGTRHESLDTLRSSSVSASLRHPRFDFNWGYDLLRSLERQGRLRRLPFDDDELYVLPEA